MKKWLLVLLVLLSFALPASALAEVPAVLAGVELEPGYYLANDEDVLSAQKPVIGGYAYLSEDGKTLTLNNYHNQGRAYQYDTYSNTALLIRQPMVLQLEGVNTLKNDAFNNNDAITANADLTIQGSGSLTADAGFGIYSNNYDATLTIAGGTLNIYGRNLVAVDTPGKLIITGGQTTIKGKEDGIYHYDGNIFISGGELKIEAGEDGIYAAKNLTISGGKVDVTGGKRGMFSRGEITISGGVIDVTTSGMAFVAEKSLNCSLPRPDGVEINGIYMDYADLIDLYVNGENPGQHTVHLPATPAAPADPSVPTTGDSAPIALWAALAVMSAAAMLLIRRRRSV